jgi:hypothetical protein
MESTITPVWYYTTSWDNQLPIKININYIIK